MKNKELSIIRLILLSVFITVSAAQDFSKVGTSVGQFLKIPIGAKAISMGGAYSAILDDASSIYWNPSGIASREQSLSVYVTHNRWIADLDHNFFGMILALDENSALGLHFISLSSGDIERTTIENPKGTGTYFDATDLSIGISYARYLVDNISVGGTAKYIQQRIWNSKATAIAFDLGILLHTGFKGLTLGFSFQNFGPELEMDGSDLIRTVDQDPNSSINPPVEAKLETESYNLPVNYRVSIAMPIIGDNSLLEFDSSELLLAIEGRHFNENFETYSFGMEYGFMKVLYFRTGYTLNTDEEGLTLGVGVKIPTFVSEVGFDYAYSEFGVFDAVHTFSLILDF